MIEEKRLDVSVYLLKSSQVAIAQAELASLAGNAVPLVREIPGGAFIALPADATAPHWVGYVATLLADGAKVDLEAQAPSGLLWIPSGKKTFVITFGYGHTRLKDEWVEPEFGKVVALCVIPQGQVVEVRAEQVFAKWHIASERAPRASAVREFGFEPDRDLVSAVEGVPSKIYMPLLGSKVRGGTSFRLGLLFSKLLETLDQIGERFDSLDHKKSWPQANNLVVVRDANIIDSLDAQLAGLLAKPKPETLIALAAPNARTGDRPYPQHYAIGRLTKNSSTAPYLLFGNWLGYLTRNMLTPNLRNARDTVVHLLDENKDEIDTCSMYQCFGAEVSLSGRPHVLSSGTWYEANHRFVKDTNTALAGLVAPARALAAWAAPEHEGEYNERACAADAELWLFDKNLVSFGGGQSRFEFCDIMHLPTRTLYFVKHPSGSAGVSHLCEQVRRTATNFFTPDGEFRLKLEKQISKNGKAWDLTWLAARPQRHDWHLCLVLMGKEAIDLPFFAKCGLARLLRELEQGGYNVSFQAV